MNLYLLLCDSDMGLGKVSLANLGCVNRNDLVSNVFRSSTFTDDSSNC
jgi:hypothetical protein